MTDPAHAGAPAVDLDLEPEPGEGYEHWRSMAADTVNHFWFTNRESGVLLAEVDRLRARVNALVERLRVSSRSPELVGLSDFRMGPDNSPAAMEAKAKNILKNLTRTACANYSRPNGVMGGPCLNCGLTQPEHVEQEQADGKLEHQHSGRGQSSQREQSDRREQDGGEIHEGTQGRGTSHRDSDVHVRREEQPDRSQASQLRHTCILDDGGTPNRRCYACERELAEKALASPSLETETLPDIEVVSAAVHEAWMVQKRAKGITTAPSQSTGEEQLRPYAELSNEVQEYDRATVRAVYAAIRASQEQPETWTVVPADPRDANVACVCAKPAPLHPGAYCRKCHKPTVAVLASPASAPTETEKTK